MGAVHNETEHRCLVYGKAVPILVDYFQSTVVWKGKNVKHDELDLEGPINDVGTCFGVKGQFVNVLNQDNKMRVYDIRGTQKRPVSDVQIKGVAPRSKMTKMAADR